jgi:hypothetical protein
MTDETSQTEQTDEGPQWVYAYRPSLMGAPWEFWLGPDALHWRVGTRAGRVDYRDVTFIRLSYRPSTLQSRRFLAEIWSKSSAKIPISSASWKGLVQQETFDEAYNSFLSELHRRIAASGAQPVLQGGSPFLLYWPGALIFLVAAVGFAFMGVGVLREAGGWTALVLAVFAVIVLWQGGSFFYLNRPRTYTIDAPPPDLLAVRKLKL